MTMRQWFKMSGNSVAEQDSHKPLLELSPILGDGLMDQAAAVWA